MKRGRFPGWWGVLGVAGGLAVAACGGESATSDDDGSGGESGESSGSGGSAGSLGGSGPKGGTSTGARGGMPGSGGSVPTGGTGGAPPDGVCDDILPCGGDPEGTWNVRENCAEILVPVFDDSPGCEGVVGAGSATIEGTFTFANGVASQDITVTVLVSVTVSDACAQGLSGLSDITAAELCPLLDLELGSNPETPGSCVVAPGGCRCDVTQAPASSTATDTYEVSGSQLTLGSGETYDFCQRGDELRMSGNLTDAATSQSLDMMLVLDRT